LPIARVAVPVDETGALARTALVESTIFTVPPAGAPVNVTSSPNIE
jgi:hypothetical protein